MRIIYTINLQVGPVSLVEEAAYRDSVVSSIEGPLFDLVVKGGWSPAYSSMPLRENYRTQVQVRVGVELERILVLGSVASSCKIMIGTVKVMA